MAGSGFGKARSPGCRLGITGVKGKRVIMGLAEATFRAGQGQARRGGGERGRKGQR